MGKRKRIGYNDEVSSGMGTRAEDTKHLSTEARERFATGTNSTKRHKAKSKGFGKLGGRGMPD